MVVGALMLGKIPRFFAGRHEWCLKNKEKTTRAIYAAINFVGSLKDVDVDL